MWTWRPPVDRIVLTMIDKGTCGPNFQSDPVDAVTRCPPDRRENGGRSPGHTSATTRGTK